MSTNLAACDGDQSDGDADGGMFVNHYECPRCGCAWTDAWPHQVDDDCPSCGCRHIAPYASEDGAP